MQIRLAVKGFLECVEEGLLACVCRCGGYGVFDLWEGAEHLVDVDYEDITDGKGCTEVGLRTGQERGEVTGFEDSQCGENQDYPEGGEAEATDRGHDELAVTVELTSLDGGV